MRAALLVLLLASSTFASDFIDAGISCEESCCPQNGGTLNYSAYYTPFCDNLNVIQSFLHDDCMSRCVGIDPNGRFYNYAALALSVAIFMLLLLGIIWEIRWRMRQK